MAGAARSKIDPQTRQLFDVEVDQPEHDEILTTLFRSEERLKGMLRALHGIKELVQPDQSHVFKVHPAAVASGYSQPKVREVNFEDAVKLVGGTPPTWKTLEPIRDLKKVLEAPLLFYTERSSRILGFIDLLITYWIPTGLKIQESSLNRGHYWEVEKQAYSVLLEVKSRWPTAGNLLRQLNMYSRCSAGKSGQDIRVVIGPDATMNDLLYEHGWRLATFTPDLKQFQFCPRPTVKVAATKAIPHSF